MIKFSDGAVLALTKLRTKPVRTIITILLASLLFGILVAASLIMTGALTSIDSFREDGLTKRHIVAVSPANTHSDLKHITRNPKFLAEAEKRYIQLVEEKTAEAKRLGVFYTQAGDHPPYFEASDGSGDRILASRDANGISNAILAEAFAGKPPIDAVALERLAKQYGAVGLFNSEYYNFRQGSSFELLKDGKEVFTATNNDAPPNTIDTTIFDYTTYLSPSTITQPFILPNNAGWKPDSNTLPIMLPQGSIEQLLNRKAPLKSSSIEDGIAHLIGIRKRAADLVISVCYRNGASQDLIQQTIQQQKDITANTGKKDYVKPSVIYELPDASSCANPTVTSDTRTKAEKQHEANQKEFNQKYNSYVDPISHFIDLKVVGISPKISNGPSDQFNNLNDVINNLLSTGGIGQAVPKELYAQIPDKSTFADILTYEPMYIFGATDNSTHFVEFQNAVDTQRFITEQGCATSMSNICEPVGRKYQITPMFSNSAAIDDIQTKAREWFNYALIGTVALAAIIMWIAVGRTMSDSRRETAIFRAIGFKRGDIASTYITYTAMLAALIAVFAAGIGVLGAYIIDRLYAPDLTVQAQYGFGALDLTKQVSLIGIDYQQLGLVLVACLATGLLSVIIPLLRNVRRNPIRDMRDEA